MSAIRTTAAIVAALALLALALFTYQGAQADREAACWAEVNARAGADLRVIAKCVALR